MEEHVFWKLCRQEKGWLVKVAAKMLKIKNNVIFYLETGKSKSISKEVRKEQAKLYGVRMFYKKKGSENLTEIDM